MNNNNTPDCTNAQQPRLDGHSASSPTLGRAPPREGPPRGMTLSPELVGDAELHRALLSLNITTPRQLRAAVDAPCQLATEAGGSDDAHPDADAFAYRGGPCVLNAALELGGHARVRSPELERIMRELVAREPEDATRAARATMDLVLGVLTQVGLEFYRHAIPRAFSSWEKLPKTKSRTREIAWPSSHPAGRARSRWSTRRPMPC